jgi:hypothetical protein
LAAARLTSLQRTRTVADMGEQNKEQDRKRRGLLRGRVRRD